VRFIVDTEASNAEIGGVPSQVQDGQEQVIAYYSKMLNYAERNCCITRRELLAIVRTLEHCFQKNGVVQVMQRHLVCRFRMYSNIPAGVALNKKKGISLHEAHKVQAAEVKPSGISRGWLLSFQKRYSFKNVEIQREG
jgi:hypothetical protein